MSRAVAPSASRHKTSPPSRSSRRTIFASPAAAATCSGVHPAPRPASEGDCGALTLTPRQRSSSSAHLTRPLAAATCSGVAPPSPRRAVAGAPDSRRMRVTSTRPAATARCSGDAPGSTGCPSAGCPRGEPAEMRRPTAARRSGSSTLLASSRTCSAVRPVVSSSSPTHAPAVATRRARSVDTSARAAAWNQRAAAASRARSAHLRKAAL
mmetsp:Transcript_5069/g.16345  ORF Transcript_5069/g.16345 Transcript_5069/m.16345 type:complete len:210 (+) Transcript_5069:415-1044(+)